MGELRSLLATTCLKALEPDLIILDEFQRFKHLLEGDDDASLLARDLFELRPGPGPPSLGHALQDVHARPRGGADDHYEDFVRTVGFLQDNPQRTEDSGRSCSAYGREALTSVDGDLASPRGEAPARAELRKVMIRTERLGATEDRNGMLEEMPAASCRLETEDLKTYLSLQRIARALDQPDTLEYWKAAPYLLSFMDEYDFKEEVTEGPRIGGEDAAALPSRPLSLSGRTSPPTSRSTPATPGSGACSTTPSAVICGVSSGCRRPSVLPAGGRPR